MKNLGKILIIFLIPHVIYASIKASLDTHYVELGDTVTYSLSISGNDVKSPNLQTICGVDVIFSSSQRSIKMINSDITKTITFSYQFIPQKSCEIKPVELEVDGVLQKSNAESLKIVPASVLKKNADFSLILNSEKKEVYVGEPFSVTLLFKQKEGVGSIDSKFVPPSFEGFWLKEQSKPVSYREGVYIVTKIVYTLAAQRVGNLKIPKAQMRIASRANMRDSWGMWIPQVKWKTYYSDDLNIDAKELPEGVELIGDFSISTKIDKTKINKNEALNLVVEVDGNGNLEDIKSFKPYIDNVSVFDEKMVIDGNKLTQKMAFVADDDFTIPPFKLKFFDTKTKQIKTIQTQKIDIKVTGVKNTPTLNIKRSDTTKNEPLKVVKTADTQNSYMVVLLAFLAGLACGIVAMLLKSYRFTKKRKSLDTKDPKVLLMKLLPYKDDKDVQVILDIIENNLYSNEKKVLDKKLLKEIIKKYKL